MPGWYTIIERNVQWGLVLYMYMAECSRWTFSLFSDLTTYDTAKQAVLNHTRLKDNIITHALARYGMYR